MTRSTVLIAMVVCLGCAHTAAEDHTQTSDVSEIYAQFLGDWTGKDKDPLSVSLSADAPSADEMKEIAECVDNGASTHWVRPEPIADLSGLVGKLPYVRMVDPSQWSPQDPGELIARGQSIESAVESGYAHGLMTFSAITFDQSGQKAAFAYSFDCGRLCGHGGTVIFVRTQGGWVESAKQCGAWISHHPDVRPGNSFKTSPLRNSA
ncbi:hypothetical protein [Agrilutibacter solisilvae]|uniref:Uncharacterized protein n=1 Tax=Agrilutibacter solisilvae TaxID=2763317 RepID=A0A974Y1K1_9GAMM|nr:hypothetical protein [Lysobacter solisilvae]QSX79721.1 hypothetical protein I8J32_007755 [Lysobacter solisilvae]